jgi:hypothetical protein
MPENLVNSGSISKLLEVIPRRDHDKIRQLCEELFISVVPIEADESKFETEISEVTVSKKGIQFVYAFIHNKSETIPLVQVLESIKRDYESADDYDEFTIHADLFMASKMGKLWQKKSENSDIESLFNLVHERKVKISKMFTRDEIESIPSEARF